MVSIDLFNELDQVYVRTNKSFNKGIYTFRSSSYYHSTKKMSKKDMFPKSV